MNDIEIRAYFHQKKLRRYHDVEDVRIFDELGLMHGACRADIAVVNGRLVGYEIKSERDTLARLDKQIPAYDAIFDAITIIVGANHRSAATKRAPKHWGVILSSRGKKGGINFQVLRKARRNPNVDGVSLARLLWKEEAVEILLGLGTPLTACRQTRSALYLELSKRMPLVKLRKAVRDYLKKRADWRDRNKSFRGDGLSQPIAMLTNSQGF